MSASKLMSIAGLVTMTVLAAATGPAAFAATTDDQVAVRVSVADLNMTSEAGARAALARIRHAAREICGDSDNIVSLSEQMRLRSCLSGTIERAVASMNSPALLAVSQSHHVTTVATR